MRVHGLWLGSLRAQPLPDYSGLGEVDLVSLLHSGIPVALPGDRRMVAGMLRPESALVGTTIRESGRALGGGTASIWTSD